MTNAYITSYASGSAIVLVQESAADGYCLQIMVKENLTLYELVGGTEIVSDNCSRMGEINNPNRPLPSRVPIICHHVDHRKPRRR